MKSLMSDIKRIIYIVSFVMFFILISPTYANSLNIVTKDIQVEGNIESNVNIRMPSIYLGTMKRIYSNYDIGTKVQLNIKNQANAQICWACSSNSVLETTVNLANKTNYMFSDEKLNENVRNIYGEAIENGANPYVAYGYYTSGNSPITVENEKTNIKVDEYTIFPSIYKKIVDENIVYQKSINSNEKYTQEEIENIRNMIKEHIMDYGAITAPTYIDYQYFSEDEESYYCDNNNVLPNHQVTIIGWDDNYSKENFNILHRPQNDGAYIVMNSYGEDFAQDGIYYISYEDVYVEYSNFGVNKISEYEKDEKIYQYDNLGINGKLEFNENVYSANVYTRDTIQVEKLSSISFSALKNGEYEIYVNPNNDNLQTNELKKVASITTQKAGYVTCDIEPINLKGEKFAIILKSKKTNGDTASVGLEINDGNLWSNATNSIGQTYLSNDGKEWFDIKELEPLINNIDNANACIKGFTKEIVLGDINSDKVFDIQDLSVALLYFSEKTSQKLNNDELYNLDVNEDKEIDIRDLSKMILMIAGIEE